MTDEKTGRNVCSWHFAPFRADAAIQSLLEQSGHLASGAYPNSDL
jgi:hypothetical protein